MKKFIVLSVLVMAFIFAGSTNLSAQQKIGYIDMAELVNLMPEKKKADTILDQYRSALLANAQEEEKELQAKVDKFIKDSATMPQAVKDAQRENLQKLYQQMSGKEQELQEKLQTKSNELSKPIQEKAMNAIKAVAKELGYAYILPKEVIYVSPDADNILEAVKKKLGLK